MGLNEGYLLKPFLLYQIELFCDPLNIYYTLFHKILWKTLISGSATGSQANPQDVSEVRQATKQLPILIGSGITPENVNEFSNADGFIVGSYLKENGLWSAEMDEKRVEKMVQAVQK